MASDSEYNTLLAKYNRMVARYRDLSQQSEERQDKWHELERTYKTNESIARELCELVLAKNPEEMVLGKEYSWSKLSFAELVRRAKIAFEQYNDDRTSLLQKIQEQSEERRLTIESLQTQLSQKMLRDKEMEELRAESADSPISDNVVTVDEETGEISDAPPAPTSTPSITEVPTKPTIPEQTLKRVSYKTQQAAKNGEIDVCILEEDSDITTEDIKQQAAVARMSQAISVEQQGYKIAPSEKKRKVMQQVRAQEEKSLVQVDANDIVRRMNVRRWYLLEVIGTTGMCEASEISDYAKKNYKQTDGEKITENGIRYEMKALTDSGCLISDSNVTHPLKSRFAVYFLSDIGKRIYLDHFGKEPVLSERDRLIAQHDNLEHGIGIKYLKGILEKSGKYETVSMDRKENTIILDDNAKYIPDIKVSGKTPRGNHTFAAYFEYERGTHSQSDFNVKLNRMAKATRTLNIVCPNAITVDELIKKTRKWVELRGGREKVSNLTVRITTLTRLNGQTDINNDENWQAVFRFKSSAEPIIR